MIDSLEWVKSAVIGKDLIDGFVVKNFLGGGGSGAVFRAEKGIEYNAIKIVDLELYYGNNDPDRALTAIVNEILLQQRVYDKCPAHVVRIFAYKAMSINGRRVMLIRMELLVRNHFRLYG